MKLSDMKSKCYLCPDYRAITYADGHVSIGCVKASSQGIWPVDIVNMDECPRSHKKRRPSTVDQMELLTVLGEIYAICCPSPSYIPLHSLLKVAGPSVKAKHNLIAKALKDLNILLITSRAAKGQRGVRVTYLWNLSKVGPPSLDMVEQINQYLSGLITREKVRMADRKMEINPIAIRHLVVDEGTTSCQSCWMRDTPDCRKRLTMMGMDCKIVNVNSLRYEEDPAVG